MHMHSNKIFKHHMLNCLSTSEKMCIMSMIGCSFMRGMFIGLYLSKK